MAMLRISQLEDEVRSRTRKVQEAAAVPQLAGHAQELESIHRRMRDPLDNASGPPIAIGVDSATNRAEEHPASRQRDVEIAQLKLHVQGLANQLTQADERLNGG